MTLRMAISELVRRLPIRQKIVFVAILSSTVALLLTLASFVAYELHEYGSTRSQALQTVARVIADNSTAALSFDDPRAASRTLVALRSESHVVSACLHDEQDRHFADYYRDGDAHVCTRETARLGGLGGDALQPVPITLDGQQIGTLYLRFEQIDIAARLFYYVTIFGFVSLTSLALAFLLARRLEKVISQPILGLVETARRVSRRDYTVRAPQESSDEIGLLVKSFNRMLDAIQRRDRQLEAHRDKLDGEVRRRTARLEEVVDRLRTEVQHRKQAEERFRYVAYHDVLTALPNRQLLRERLELAMRTARRERHRVALLFLDLDRFKEINDSFGHAMGDTLLKHVADRLVGCVRGSDGVTRVERSDEQSTVSRQGGDEFTVLLSRIAGISDISRIANRVLASLREPFQLGSHEIVVGASIGIAIFPDDGVDAETLLKHADAAMYHAKAAGRNDFAFFNESMRAAALQRITLERDLRHALERQEFELCYQPQVSLRDNRIIGVEALLRWRLEDGRHRLPGDFIPAAEETGLIVPIGEWVLRRACEQGREWQAMGLPPVKIAVNVSSRQFRKGAFFEAARAILDETGFPPHLLELEVTESSMLQDEDDVVRTLNKLGEIGVGIALDDFGTGYSSLSSLRRLPFDSLKIDQSFIEDLGVRTEAKSIVSAIIAMSHNLGLTVVAEGVRSESQRDFVRDQLCDVYQGNFFATAEPASRIVTLLEARRTDLPVV
ncbi:MAG: EAL domain-containing protein [Vicinamibacterales bacterium]